MFVEKGVGCAKRTRPSLDVLLSALCVLESSPNEAQSTSAKPCLVSGVAIRRTTIDIDACALDSNASDDANSEVHLLNQVNQALSKESTPVIPHSASSTPPTPNPYVNYLLVHDITSLGSSNRNSAARPSSAKSNALGGTKQVASDWWKDTDAMAHGSTEGDVFITDFTDADFMTSKVAVSDAVISFECTYFIFANLFKLLDFNFYPNSFTQNNAGLLVIFRGKEAASKQRPKIAGTFGI